MQRIVRSGVWLYGDEIYKKVFIVEQNYDYWYELGKADDNLEPGERPTLNSEGLVYYVMYEERNMGRPWSPSSPGFETVDDACRFAETQLPSCVTWRHPTRREEMA